MVLRDYIDKKSVATNYFEIATFYSQKKLEILHINYKKLKLFLYSRFCNSEKLSVQKMNSKRESRPWWSIVVTILASGSKVRGFKPGQGP